MLIFDSVVVPVTVKSPATVEEACETKPDAKVCRELHTFAVVVPNARESVLPDNWIGYVAERAGVSPSDEVARFVHALPFQERRSPQLSVIAATSRRSSIELSVRSSAVRAVCCVSQ